MSTELTAQDAPPLEPEQVEPRPHVVCPWCWGPVVERSNRDARFRSFTYVGRTYRCDPCQLTVYANQDGQVIT